MGTDNGSDLVEQAAQPKAEMTTFAVTMLTSDVTPETAGQIMAALIEKNIKAVEVVNRDFIKESLRHACDAFGGD